MPPHPRDTMTDDMHKNLLQLPVKVFLYNLEQIATMLDVTEKYLKRSIIYFQGRETVRWASQDMVAINIAKVNAPPEWRVSEAEFIRWMKFKGIKFTAPARVNGARNIR